jgi:hypothetical protein
MSSSTQRGALRRSATQSRGKIPAARVRRNAPCEEEEDKEDESAVENPDNNTKRLVLDETSGEMTRSGA